MCDTKETVTEIYGCMTMIMSQVKTSVKLHTILNDIKSVMKTAALSLKKYIIFFSGEDFFIQWRSSKIFSFSVRIFKSHMNFDLIWFNKLLRMPQDLFELIDTKVMKILNHFVKGLTSNYNFINYEINLVNILLN